VEGSLIYAFSAAIRDEILENGKAIIHLDLAPDWTIEQLETRLSRPRGSRSISSFIEKSIGIHGVKAGLLWEYLPRSTFNDPKDLAATIKALPVPLVAPRPIEEAISTAGGVRFEDLDDHLMLKKIPGVFCAGEMLDWEAPTGGYLLTACFSTGLAAAHGVIDWLRKKDS
jgi:predicted flavoprotein YhiN